MLYRTLGRNRQRVSQLGFGLMRLPTLGGDNAKIDEEKALKLLQYGVDKGITYLDTAYPYHSSGAGEAGMSEPFLAKALQKGGYRHKVQVVSKLPSWLVKTSEDMDRLLDEQLQRVGVDYFDFYLLHTINTAFWEKYRKVGFEDFLDRAKGDGRIGNAAFSYHGNTPELFKEIVDTYPWDMCQIQYNYMDEDYQAGREGLEYAASKDIGVVVMEPLKGGLLANSLPEEARKALGTRHPQWTPAEWSFRWLWNHENVKVVLSGMNEFDQLEENLKVASSAMVGELTEEDYRRTSQASRIMKERVKVPCTACGYCMPCPVGVDIPGNFELYNGYFRFDSKASRQHEKVMYRTHFDEDKKANKCVRCGACESHCPQGIKIPAELEKVTRTLGELA